MPRSLLVGALALAASILLPKAMAQDGLYEPSPPADSAFVRVLNAPAASIGPKRVAAPAGGASAYVVAPQGEVTVQAGGRTQKFSVQAGRFYSVAVRGDRLALLVDPPAENRAKALLVLYNLGGAAGLALKTADGKTAVIEGVKSGASGSRAVNGVTVDLAVFAGPKKLGTLPGVKLERGRAYAVVVTSGGVTLTASTTSVK